MLSLRGLRGANGRRPAAASPSLYQHIHAETRGAERQPPFQGTSHLLGPAPGSPCRACWLFQAAWVPTPPCTPGFAHLPPALAPRVSTPVPRSTALQYGHASLFTPLLSFLFFCPNFLGSFATLNQRGENHSERRYSREEKRTDPGRPPTHGGTGAHAGSISGPGEEPRWFCRFGSRRDTAKGKRKHHSTSPSLASPPQQLVFCTQPLEGRGFFK